ncbi:MAG: nitrate ABC transporter substrate-binding protein [Geminicoccaceae bacterium]|jgi:NitT/TauT family transport system substrate-binding protein|nr:MAG: nitrate ABC transporter substrate-binding protein [Geminicoccaceae bacterium]
MGAAATRRDFLLATAASLPLLAGRPAAAAGKVRVALGDVLSTETLCVQIALERAKERGVDYELTSFSKEDLAIQAVIGGQADLGVGTPYAVIQKTKVPLKILFQINRLVFFPVVDASYKSWKDLDGQPFAFHARGSGTEAIGNIIARREGITFGQRSYVPGSENRVVAMLNGQIKATIVDLANKNLLLEKGGDRFRVLPGVDQPASDETLFGRKDWIDANRPVVETIVEAFLATWRQMVANPAWVEEERARRNLLADRPKELLAGVEKFYRQGVEAGMFSADGGGATAARADFEFYTEAGQLQGPASSLAVEEFWDLGPLEAARKKLGV